MSFSLGRSAILLAAVAAGTLSIHAQSTYGGLRGLVTDSSGSAMGSAKVTLINQGTADTRASVTSPAGEYVFSQVIPGTYTVTVESQGFKKFERKGILVETQNQLTVDVKMELGAVTESVQVTEEVPLIETATASQGQMIDRQKMIDLPNLGRNPYMFSKLAPNVMQVGNPAYARMQDQSGSSAISIAGGPVRGNNYLIDGIPITDMNNRAIIIASLEAVQEMKVQSNSYDAEIGRSGGGMFNALLKSGTNEYHGSLGGLMRNTDWIANDFFNNRAGNPVTDQPNRTYYGSFGGPVRVPKIYNGTNKTFFWLTFEGYRDTQANSGSTAVPTMLERAGNFSQSSVKIFDPLATGADGLRQQFPGNVIPSSRISPVGLAIAGTFPTPPGATASYGALNMPYSGKLPSKADQKTAKLDHRFFQWWQMSLSYMRYNSLEPGETWFPDSISTPEQWRLDRKVDATQVNSSMTLDPTTVLALRYGFNRFPNYGFQKSQGFSPSTLGFSSNFTRDIASATFPNVAFQSMYPGDNMGTNNNFLYVPYSNSFNGSLSKYLGRHNLKFGADWRKIQDAGIDFGDSSGNFTFDNTFTRSNYSTSTAGQGADIASLLLGAPASATGFRSTKLYEYLNYYSTFVQDDIRFSPKLTINAGLRWERESGLQERSRNLIVGFDRNALNSISALSGVPTRGAVMFAGQNGAPTETGHFNKNKLSPRLGAAYQIDPKTTVRGGWGLFWAPQIAVNSPYLPEGFTSSTQPAASNDGGRTPAISLSNPFPNGLDKPVGSSLGDATGIGKGLTIFDPNSKSTYVQQFSVDIQRELPMNIALSVAYVGSRTKNLTLTTATLNYNQLETKYIGLGTAGLSAPVANPYAGKGGSGAIGSASIAQNQLLRPFPAFGNLSYIFSDQNHARYDSMVLRAQKRFSQGLTFLTAFTWSKNYDAGSGGAGNNLNGGNTGPQNVYDLGREYGLSYLHSPLRWTLSSSYELPFGKGKPFLSGVPGAVNYVVGGWSVNVTSVIHAGFPLQIRQSSNNNGLLFTASQRPNATGIDPATSGSIGQRIDNYINPAAFSIAPALTFGNVSRTIPVLSPGQFNWDLSFFKTVAIHERFKAQFRAEALNATNTPLFRAPNTAFGNGSFGHISSQANFARMIQLGLRLYF